MDLALAEVDSTRPRAASTSPATSSATPRSGWRRRRGLGGDTGLVARAGPPAAAHPRRPGAADPASTATTGSSTTACAAPSTPPNSTSAPCADSESPSDHGAGGTGLVRPECWALHGAGRADADGADRRLARGGRRRARPVVVDRPRGPLLGGGGQRPASATGHRDSTVAPSPSSPSTARVHWSPAGRWRSAASTPARSCRAGRSGAGATTSTASSATARHDDADRPASAVLNASAGSPFGNVLQLAALRDATCAVLANHQVRCWGDNEHGQLGNGSTADRSLPVAVRATTGGSARSTTVTQVDPAATPMPAPARAAGGSAAGAATTQGQLRRRHRDRAPPTPCGSNTRPGPALLRDAVQVSAGGGHTCARLEIPGRPGAGRRHPWRRRPGAPWPGTPRLRRVRTPPGPDRWPASPASTPARRTAAPGSATSARSAAGAARGAR